MSFKCHSAYVHYNMYHDHHCRRGGDIIGSVFNITNNCSGNHGGFLKGLGSGFGWGLGTLFAGMINMFCGFGFGSVASLGMNCWSNLWGGGGSSSVTDDYSKYSSDKTKCKCGCGDKKDVGDATDPDCQKIADFQKELNEFTVYDETKYNDLKTRIEEAKTASEADPKNKDANIKSYNELLATLETKKPTKSAEVVVGKESEVDANTPKIKIGDTDVKISDVTIQVINGWSKDNIDKLSKEDAVKVLEQVNLVATIGGNKLVKATTGLNLLRLAEKSGLELAFGHNTTLDNKAGALPHIDGTITNVRYDNDTKVITFDLEDDKGKYEMKCTEGGDKLTLVKELENKDTKYSKAKENTEYTINTEDNDPYAIRAGVATKRKINANNT